MRLSDLRCQKVDFIYDSASFSVFPVTSDRRPVSLIIISDVIRGVFTNIFAIPPKVARLQFTLELTAVRRRWRTALQSSFDSLTGPSK